MGYYNLISHIRKLEIMKAELIEKKELITKFVEPHNQDQFKKWSVKDLRNHFGITHKINGQYKNMSGYCFKCFKPLRPDYTQFENYCLDC
tara:strand:- start:400 stop:669 length:270 start_codon:yes stop_codon:yes gene_type:complete